MTVINVNQDNTEFNVRNVETEITIQSIGLKGVDGVGVPAGGDTGQVLAKNSNTDYDTEWVDVVADAVSSVNGQTGAVVLDAADVGADSVGSASQALQDANDYTDAEVSTLDSSLATVAKTGSYDDLSNKPTIPSIAGLATEAQVQDVQDNLDAHEADTANPHNVTKVQVGLGNVANLAPADMPVSTATQTALDGKLNKLPGNNVIYSQNSTGVETLLTYSAAENPNTIAQRNATGQLTGAEPTANNHLATKLYVDNGLATKADTTSLANYVLKAGDTMTGMLNNTNSSAVGYGHTRGGITSTWGTAASGRYIVTQNGPVVFNASTIGIRIGDDTAGATHTLTLPSTATGIALYNTVDQTTNYERVLQSWVSNVYTINQVSAGTGTNRSLALQTTLRSGETSSYNMTRNSLPFHRFSVSNAVAGAGIWYQFEAPGGLAATSGIQTFTSFQPTVGQSGTAGYTTLLINPTETSTGSGAKLLIDAQMNGTSRFSVSNTGRMVVGEWSAFGGVATPTALVDIAPSGASRSALRIRSGVAPTSPNDGDIWFDGSTLKIRISGTTRTFTVT